MPELRHPRPGPDAARGQPRRAGRPRPPEEGALIPRPTGRPRTLVLGIGNPGRRDDGLGAAAVERLKRRRLRGVTCDANYQLNIEDALACAAHEIVVFVDAGRGLRKPFTFAAIEPDPRMPAMSHALGPAAVLALAETLYEQRPEARLLAIRGHDFSVGEGLTRRAEGHLALALIFLEAFLKGVRT
ncbi:MAG: hydrogenase maturation protease [Candidatus Aminicenantales bacterium]